MKQHLIVLSSKPNKYLNGKIMTSKKITEKSDRRVLLSTLWIVVMINMLKADILTLYIPGSMDELIKFAGDTPITQLMLAGAIMMEISIAMIFLSRVLKYGVNRWANMVTSIIVIVFVIGGGSTYPHYIFIATVEVICLLSIAWIAWKWSDSEVILKLKS
jgi:hypothetical protein